MFKKNKSSLLAFQIAFFCTTVVALSFRDQRNVNCEIGWQECITSKKFQTNLSPSLVYSKSELDENCPELKKVLKCVDNFSTQCLNVQQQDAVRALFETTNILVQNLCINETYQEIYLSHVPCLRNVQYKTCLKIYESAKKEIDPTRPGHKDQKKIFCLLHRYVECSVNNVRQACGQDPAQMIEEILNLSVTMSQWDPAKYNSSECDSGTGINSIANAEESSQTSAVHRG